MFHIGVFQSITTHVIEQSDGIATDLLFKQPHHGLEIIEFRGNLISSVFEFCTEDF